jgi:hypothetical protein
LALNCALKINKTKNSGPRVSVDRSIGHLIHARLKIETNAALRLDLFISRFLSLTLRWPMGIGRPRVRLVLEQKVCLAGLLLRAKLP